MRYELESCHRYRKVVTRYCCYHACLQYRIIDRNRASKTSKCMSLPYRLAPGLSDSERALPFWHKSCPSGRRSKPSPKNVIDIVRSRDGATSGKTVSAMRGSRHSSSVVLCRLHILAFVLLASFQSLLQRFCTACMPPESFENVVSISPA